MDVIGAWDLLASEKPKIDKPQGNSKMGKTGKYAQGMDLWWSKEVLLVCCVGFGLCFFFLNGIVFLSGHGGGFFPVQNLPAIIDTGEVTVGRPQLGIVRWLRSVGEDCWVRC